MWHVKEELLKDAIEVGRIPVLEFAVQEAHDFTHLIDEKLYEKAETKFVL